MARGTSTIANARHRSALNADPGPRMVEHHPALARFAERYGHARTGVPAPNLQHVACGCGLAEGDLAAVACCSLPRT